MSIENLQWDSEFFELKVGKLVIQKGGDIDFYSLNNFDLVYLFIEPDDLESNWMALDSGAFLVDEKVTYLKKPFPSGISIPEITTYISSGQDKDDEVFNVAIQSGIYSRFKIDPKFSDNKFILLYKTWIQKSIDRIIAQEVYVSKQGKSINGVVTVGEKKGRADIGLIAVEKNSRGKNIGKKLLQRVEAYCVENNYNELQVVTQKANSEACRFYEKNGFSIDSQINIYHFWKK